MPILFTDLVHNPVFAVKNRKQLKELYEHVKSAVKADKLSLEGHTLPESFNDWISQIEGAGKLPKTDTDVVNFSLALDQKYESWRKSYLMTQNPIFMTQPEKDFIEVLQDLESATSNSLSLINGTKDDVVAALSDLQAAIALFLTHFDKHHKKLNLPDRKLALEQIQIRKNPKQAKLSNIQRVFEK